MTSLKRITTLQYMGSKSRILESICEPILQDQEITTVVDVFAGTGAVGYALAPYKHIISNDIEYYAYILNEAILNGCFLSDHEFQSFIQSVKYEYIKRVSSSYVEKAIKEEERFFSLDSSHYQEYADFSDNTPSVFNAETSIKVLLPLQALVSKVKPGQKEQDIPFDCLFLTYFANAYFGIRQCCEIDAIVSAIKNLKESAQQKVLLGALMSAMSATASTTTHFAQFLKVKSPRTFSNIVSKREKRIIELFKQEVTLFRENDLLNRKGKKCVCKNMNYAECLQDIVLDKNTLVYADPPYFKEHYSRYYHVLNTLCLYDYPELAMNTQRNVLSVGRYRADRISSDFGKRSKVVPAFKELIGICSNYGANLMISYSENSLVKIQDLIKLAQEKYNVRIKKVELKHSNQGRATEADQTVNEYIIMCTIPNKKTLCLESKADEIRKIKPVVDNPGGFMHNYMARKPYTVTSAVINAFSKPSDLVYDPMFGSGTTLIEASKLGRKAIGTDINPVASLICSVSLKKWDLNKISYIIDKFIEEVKTKCNAVYIFSKGSETRVIERIHFDVKDNCLVPTSYWYKVKNGTKLSGRKREEADAEFIKCYNDFEGVPLNNIHNHKLIPNSRIAIKDGETVFDLFCYRNLKALDIILGILKNYEQEYGYDVLKLIVSSAVNLIRLSDKKASSQMPYWIPKHNATSRNAVFVLQKKAKAIKKGLQYLRDNCKFFTNNGDVRIYSDPAQSISSEKLSDSTVDLVLTDPPYTDQVPYLEYSQLGFDLFEINNDVDYLDELVVSDAPSRDKSKKEFDYIFEQIIARTEKALKPDGLFIMFYHTFDLKSWDSILTMMQRHYLRYVYQIPTPSPRKSFKTVMSPRSTLDGNYLLFFRKSKEDRQNVFEGSAADAVQAAIKCAENIIRTNENVTTQDLYDHGMLREAFEDGYLSILAESYDTFAEVIRDKFTYEDGYWRLK